MGVRIVRAVRVAARRIVGRDRQRIAALAPIALVIARASILVEVAVAVTRCIVLTRDTAEVGIFGVVARAGTLAIRRVREPIPVVVDAVPAVIDFALTSRDPALGRCARRILACGSTRRRSATTAAVVTRVRQRQVLTNLDAIGTRPCQGAGNDRQHSAPGSNPREQLGHHGCFGIASLG